jgi:hypothetical protein
VFCTNPRTSNWGFHYFYSKPISSFAVEWNVNLRFEGPDDHGAWQLPVQYTRVSPSLRELDGFLSHSEHTLRFRRLPIATAESPGTNRLPSVNIRTVHSMHWWYTSSPLFHPLRSITNFTSVCSLIRNQRVHMVVLCDTTRCLPGRDCLSLN